MYRRTLEIIARRTFTDPYARAAIQSYLRIVSEFTEKFKYHVRPKRKTAQVDGLLPRRRSIPTPRGGGHGESLEELQEIVGEPQVIKPPGAIRLAGATAKTGLTTRSEERR